MRKPTDNIVYKLKKWYFSREALPFWAIATLDIIIIFMSMVLMYSVVYGPAHLVGNASRMLYTFLIDMVFYCIGMRVFHTYADVSRLLEFRDLSRTAFAILLGTVLCMALRWAVDLLPFTEQVPYRVFILVFVCATVLLCAWRAVAKTMFDLVRENIREEVELLPRREIEINMEKIGEQLSGKRVLVTGAAGSIGSEIVRQIASYTPNKLILIDQAETPMHDLMLELQNKWNYIDALFFVATITDKERMGKIFNQYKPDYVFHAAAYKHVPMMEDNPCASIYNNVMGTRIIADLAVENKVK
jgi:FlaA1/EpsC-like NDP-sugar epimerase